VGGQPDETDPNLIPHRRSASIQPGWELLVGADPLLLASLADAADALARLDACTAAAVQEGLLLGKPLIDSNSPSPRASPAEGEMRHPLVALILVLARSWETRPVCIALARLCVELR
jgi:hypothetical protein